MNKEQLTEELRKVRYLITRMNRKIKGADVYTYEMIMIKLNYLKEKEGNILEQLEKEG